MRIKRNPVTIIYAAVFTVLMLLLGFLLGDLSYLKFADDGMELIFIIMLAVILLIVLICAFMLKEKLSLKKIQKETPALIIVEGLLVIAMIGFGFYMGLIDDTSVAIRIGAYLLVIYVISRLLGGRLLGLLGTAFSTFLITFTVNTGWIDLSSEHVLDLMSFLIPYLVYILMIRYIIPQFAKNNPVVIVSLLILGAVFGTAIVMNPISCSLCIGCVLAVLFSKLRTADTALTRGPVTAVLMLFFSLAGTVLVALLMEKDISLLFSFSAENGFVQAMDAGDYFGYISDKLMLMLDQSVFRAFDYGIFPLVMIIGSVLSGYFVIRRKLSRFGPVLVSVIAVIVGYVITADYGSACVYFVSLLGICAAYGIYNLLLPEFLGSFDEEEDEEIDTFDLEHLNPPDVHDDTGVENDGENKDAQTASGEEIQELKKHESHKKSKQPAAGTINPVSIPSQGEMSFQDWHVSEEFIREDKIRKERQEERERVYKEAKERADAEKAMRDMASTGIPAAEAPSASDLSFDNSRHDNSQIVTLSAEDVQSPEPVRNEVGHTEDPEENKPNPNVTLKQDSVQPDGEPVGTIKLGDSPLREDDGTGIIGQGRVFEDQHLGSVERNDEPSVAGSQYTLGLSSSNKEKPKSYIFTEDDDYSADDADNDGLSSLYDKMQVPSFKPVIDEKLLTSHLISRSSPDVSNLNSVGDDGSELTSRSRPESDTIVLGGYDDEPDGNGVDGSGDQTESILSAINDIEVPAVEIPDVPDISKTSEGIQTENTAGSSEDELAAMAAARELSDARASFVKGNVDEIATETDEKLDDLLDRLDISEGIKRMNASAREDMADVIEHANDGSEAEVVLRGDDYNFGEEDSEYGEVPTISELEERWRAEEQLKDVPEDQIPDVVPSQGGDDLEFSFTDAGEQDNSFVQTSDIDMDLISADDVSSHAESDSISVNDLSEMISLEPEPEISEEVQMAAEPEADIPEMISLEPESEISEEVQMAAEPEADIPEMISLEPEPEISEEVQMATEPEADIPEMISLEPESEISEEVQMAAEPEADIPEMISLEPEPVISEEVQIAAEPEPVPVMIEPVAPIEEPVSASKAEFESMSFRDFAENVSESDVRTAVEPEPVVEPVPVFDTAADAHEPENAPHIKKFEPERISRPSQPVQNRTKTSPVYSFTSKDVNIDADDDMRSLGIPKPGEEPVSAHVERYASNLERQGKPMAASLDNYNRKKKAENKPIHTEDIIAHRGGGSREYHRIILK